MSAPDIFTFAEDIDVHTLARALHFLPHDHRLVVAARLGLELGDQRRAIGDELKAVALDVHAGWTADPALLAIRSRPARFLGVPREPVRCDRCHHHAPLPKEAAA